MPRVGTIFILIIKFDIITYTVHLGFCSKGNVNCC
jgi:hypothetical protein